MMTKQKELDLLFLNSLIGYPEWEQVSQFLPGDLEGHPLMPTSSSQISLVFHRQFSLLEASAELIYSTGHT